MLVLRIAFYFFQHPGELSSSDTYCTCRKWHVACTWCVSSAFVYSSHPLVQAREEDGKKPIASSPQLALSLLYKENVMFSLASQSGHQDKICACQLCLVCSNASTTRRAFTLSHFSYLIEYLNWVVSLRMLPLLLIQKFSKDSLSILLLTLLFRVVSFSHWLCRHPEVTVIILPWNSGTETFSAYLPSMNVASFSAKFYDGDV